MHLWLWPALPGPRPFLSIAWMISARIVVRNWGPPFPTPLPVANEAVRRLKTRLVTKLGIIRLRPKGLDGKKPVEPYQPRAGKAGWDDPVENIHFLNRFQRLGWVRRQEGSVNPARRSPSFSAIDGQPLQERAENRGFCPEGERSCLSLPGSAHLFQHVDVPLPAHLLQDLRPHSHAHLAQMSLAKQKHSTCAIVRCLRLY